MRAYLVLNKMSSAVPSIIPSENDPYYVIYNSSQCAQYQLPLKLYRILLERYPPSDPMIGSKLWDVSFLSSASVTKCVTEESFPTRFTHFYFSNPDVMNPNVMSAVINKSSLFYNDYYLHYAESNVKNEDGDVSCTLKTRCISNDNKTFYQLDVLARLWRASPLVISVCKEFNLLGYVTDDNEEDEDHSDKDSKSPVTYLDLTYSPIPAGYYFEVNDQLGLGIEIISPIFPYWKVISDLLLIVDRKNEKIKEFGFLSKVILDFPLEINPEILRSATILIKNF